MIEESALASEKPNVMDVAGIRIERLADGSARLTHPSGLVVVEKREYREARTAARIADLQAALQTETDCQAAFAALAAAAREMQEP